MHNNPMKFERQERLRELDIDGSLKRLGLEAHHHVCDYGAGTGIVSAKVTNHTGGQVYALDMDPKMIDLITQKKEQGGIKNLFPMKVEKDQVPLEDQSLDHFLLVTVLHEINEVPEFVQEVHRVLKPGGKVMVIDFYKKETKMGPPMDHRMSAYQASRHFFREGIHLEEQYELSDNFYLLVLSKA